MSYTVRITPAGRLVLLAESEAVPALDRTLAETLASAFEESSASGLLWLVSNALETPLPPALVYWRSFAQQCLHAVCHVGEEGLKSKQAIAALSEEERQALTAAAPPMRGLEYLTPEVLATLWSELTELVTQQARQHPQGLGAYLQSINPVWHLLGRVTFHLAENKRDERRPFAFLATYTNRVSAGARLQHVPLAEALKQYAGEKNQPRMTALLEPVRRAAAGSTLVRELLDSRALFQPQAWTVGEAYRLLLEVPKLEAAGLVVRVPDWWKVRRPTRPQVQVHIGQKQSGQLGMHSLLDFSAEVAIDGEPLSAEERERILQASDGLVLLRGSWVEVDKERLAQALDHWRMLEQERPDGLTFIEGMRLLSGAQIEKDFESDEAADWSRISAGEWLRETLETIRQPSAIEAFEPGGDLQATLRPYQADGVRWLWFMTRLGLGACLADDMGLGKTIQVIDLLLQLKRETAANTSSESNGQNGEAVPSLLVVPASLIGNWKQELERFAPSLSVFFAHRSECHAEDLELVASSPVETLTGFDVVVTTYQAVRQGRWLKKVDWRLVVLDEAQAIKNASSAQTKAVKGLKSSGRIVLTGTPVENHLGDLWSIFDFCCPGLLGSATQFKQFVRRLNQQQDSQAFGSLRRLVKPYLLRRLKTDPHVAGDLPAKTEMRVECGLAKKQAVLYEKAVQDLAKRLKEADGMARRGLVLAVLMQLKQICNHPAQYLNETRYVPGDSGKFGRLRSICEPIIERQEKMLVFTQFQSICEPLANFLSEVFGRPGLTLSGKTAVRKRTELVRAFQDENGPPFFVISVKAGGSGLNLTAASHVVHFDRWWNPAVENQATDRAFRIGQKRNVLVHKFVCRGTVEERIDQMIQDKRELAEQLLEPGKERLLTEMPDDELLSFVAIDLNRAAADE